ncbi:MAG: polysaccharide deacetylase family protein [Bacteroidia bacterium]|nr:polysaccharide deacetylase family protein [Bacteroidia bacterium]MCF8427877.1 polysaccharide deacetylase family protein [Bacteroidia bacterium]MCF8447278.1 polysaccharide deacetylase family protein [Bacteroidia bacterium]
MKNNLIINFHVINDSKWFEKVVLLLKSKYTMVELAFFENSDNYLKKKGFCHLTFDDGDRTFYTIAYPILKKYNVPATIFVSPKSVVNQENFWFQKVQDFDKNTMNKILSKELSLPLEKISKTGFINILKCLTLTQINEIIVRYKKETNTQAKSFQNMNLSEIFEVEKSGLITVGAHTLNHPILKNENDKICFKEISESITDLQKLLGHEIKYFAYPNGAPKEDFGDREIEILNKQNIAIAFSSESKFISRNVNRLAFPRLGLSNGSMAYVKLKLTLGANWERLKSLLPNTEIKNRRYVTSISENLRNL